MRESLNASGDDILVELQNTLDVYDVALTTPIMYKIFGDIRESETKEYSEGQYQLAYDAISDVFINVFKNKYSTVDNLREQIAQITPEALEPILNRNINYHQNLGKGISNEDAQQIFADDVKEYFTKKISHTKNPLSQSKPLFDVIKKNYRDTHLNIDDKSAYEKLKTTLGIFRRNLISAPLAFVIGKIPPFIGVGELSRIDNYSKNSALTEAVFNTLKNVPPDKSTLGTIVLYSKGKQKFNKDTGQLCPKHRI